MQEGPSSPSRPKKVRQGLGVITKLAFLGGLVEFGARWHFRNALKIHDQAARPKKLRQGLGLIDPKLAHVSLRGFETAV